MNLQKFHYECILSIKKNMPDYNIIIYTDNPPIENLYWQDLLKLGINFEIINVPTYFDGFELKYNQYKADVLRLEILYEKGGIYLDLDMLIIKNFENIFNSNKDFYISKETANGNGLINSFLASKPKNEFIKLWLDSFKIGLRQNKWAYHIRESNKQLLENNKHYMLKYNIEILENKYFFPFEWTEYDKFKNIKDNLNEDIYGIHLFETILTNILINNKYFDY
jgi:hypothetical protein